MFVLRMASSNVQKAQVLMLQWMDLPDASFDFLEVFAGKQALTQAMCQP